MAQPLKDDSLMPYGKHKGKKMKDIPASYLLWLFTSRNYNNEVKRYILNNMAAIESKAIQESKSNNN